MTFENRRMIQTIMGFQDGKENIMTVDFVKEAENIRDELIAIRREIHENPELGDQEFETSRLIREFLHKHDIEVETMLDTAVIGILRGAYPGKTVALRADMDALPIQEDTGLPFASKKPGLMHACGHDTHVTAVLGAAKLLAQHRDQLHGNVKFFFQPNEEGWGGAERMVAAGCMKNPDVDAVFGTHIVPGTPTGVFKIKEGNKYAASSVFEVTVHGKQTHGAAPSAGIDPLVVAAQIVLALQTIVSRRTDVIGSPTLLTIYDFHYGSGYSIISPEVKMTGMHRTYGREKQEKVDQMVRKIVQGVAEANDATADVKITHDSIGVFNHKKSADLVARSIRELFGEEALRDDVPGMGTEDFGYFIADCEGAYYLSGAGNPDLFQYSPGHTPKFMIDEAAIPKMAALHAQVVVNYLEEEQ